MDARRLDIGEIVRFAWEKTRSNLSQLIVIMIVAIVANAIPSGMAESLEDSSPGPAALFRLVSFVISMLVGIGAVRIGLKLHDGQPTAISDLFAADWSLFWRYTVATILYALIVGIGLVLFVIPGVIFGVRYLFYAYFVFERGARPVEALAQSAAATQGVRWDVFLFGVVMLLLILLGTIALVVGLLITVPLVYVATARAYRTLTGSAPTIAPSAGVVPA